MENSDDIKTRIREKAKELFMHYGIQRVSMSDIANANGISKKTLYQQYPDKENLVVEAIDVIIQGSNYSCECSRQNADNAIHESFLAVDDVTELLKKLNPVLLIDMQRYYPSAYKRFMDYKQQFLYNYIKSNLEWGIQDGLYRADINVKMISLFRIETIGIPFQKEFLDKAKLDLATVQKELFLFFLHGLATPKGIKHINKYNNQRAKQNI
ncbi:MAG TPA: TetR/AcrR family transcriptional regulator [Niabella sp.]|nr:TetR/AcrR family transcriptional regulator [Niabella sp.]HOZ97915.1 TetR/AcrR family transcriptional regulator [Niabella sp.]HQW15939.1 TetR/AcrR family transcriptional regulator [Niabella sp.]HQX21113.1 TetR/AcrR family transcriptional regulator [Niabella sp.]HQX40561.1 TetR/AcrR family transcriptional regulator [Niabella sp.]